MNPLKNRIKTEAIEAKKISCKFLGVFASPFLDDNVFVVLYYTLHNCFIYSLNMVVLALFI